MNRHLINISIFIAAVILYALGFAYSAAFVVFVAMFVELVFWVRLFRGIHRRKT